MLESLLLTLEGSQETSIQVRFFKYKIFFAYNIGKFLCLQLHTVCFVLHKIPKLHTILEFADRKTYFQLFSNT